MDGISALSVIPQPSIYQPFAVKKMTVQLVSP